MRDIVAGLAANDGDLLAYGKAAGTAGIGSKDQLGGIEAHLLTSPHPNDRGLAAPDDDLVRDGSHSGFFKSDGVDSGRLKREPALRIHLEPVPEDLDPGGNVKAHA